MKKIHRRIALSLLLCFLAGCDAFAVALSEQNGIGTSPATDVDAGSEEIRVFCPGPLCIDSEDLPTQGGDSTCGPCDHNPKPPPCCGPSGGAGHLKTDGDDDE